jgi:hypothetical protein
MSYDFSTGLSGAASGAAAGSQVLPGWGTAIGGGVGLLSGFFGGDDGGSPARDRAIQRNRESLRALTDRYETRLEESPTETAFFQTGVGQLQEQADRQSDRDAAQAAARGLGGSQFELAQDANRAQTQSEALRSLVRGAEEMDNRNEQRALQNMQRQREALNALVSDQARMQDRRQAQQGQALQQSFSQLPFLLSQADFGFGEDERDRSALNALVDPMPTGGGRSGVPA